MGGGGGSNRVYYRGFENREFGVKHFWKLHKKNAASDKQLLFDQIRSDGYYCIPKITWESLIFEGGIISGIVYIVQNLWVLHNYT